MLNDNVSFKVKEIIKKYELIESNLSSIPLMVATASFNTSSTADKLNVSALFTSGDIVFDECLKMFGLGDKSAEAQSKKAYVKQLQDVQKYRIICDTLTIGIAKEQRINEVFELSESNSTSVASFFGLKRKSTEDSTVDFCLDILDKLLSSNTADFDGVLKEALKISNTYVSFVKLSDNIASSKVVMPEKVKHIFDSASDEKYNVLYIKDSDFFLNIKSSGKTYKDYIFTSLAYMSYQNIVYALYKLRNRNEVEFCGVCQELIKYVKNGNEVSLIRVPYKLNMLDLSFINEYKKVALFENYIGALFTSTDDVDEVVNLANIGKFLLEMEDKLK